MEYKVQIDDNSYVVEIEEMTDCNTLNKTAEDIAYSAFLSEYDYEHLQIFNNGTVELRMDLYVHETNKSDPHLKTEHWLDMLEFWDELQKLIDDTSEMYKILNRAAPMYLCVTICGCKGLWNYEANLFGTNTPTRVDRNEVVCAPIEISSILDDEQRARRKEDCVRMTKYALGIRK